ncbi:hypothetical protein GSI_14894 [Ganoderma sinense ZZ0214-1]|uniref:BTB domain-containing protein n=1 Tax=Ganoderma sinense ZZ0214-1 TaxID=1077348 RepID=A0A2G8RQ09_9APHY|nr:hypothetical protein GSI_14894 [Ganoderma sinense ZZ0214-1]
MNDIAGATALPLEELRRDEDFWLEDGSVVLVAKKTAFKVYKGLLSAHSPVFSDMFSSTTHADETYDGSPVVRLSDSPEDLKWVLTHVMPKTLRHLQGTYDFKSSELSALARLGHKYQIDLLERHAVDSLKAAFTNDFEQWEGRLRSPQVPSHSGYSRYNPIDIINIARLTNTPSMLPLAFCLCAQNRDIIVDGQARGDGTHLFLSKTDAKRCIVGLAELSWTLQQAVP